MPSINCDPFVILDINNPSTTHPAGHFVRDAYVATRAIYLAHPSLATQPHLYDIWIRSGPVGIRASFARTWTTSAWLRTIPRRIGPKAGQSNHTCKVEDTKARPPLRTLTVKCLVLGSDAGIPDKTPHTPLVEEACTAHTLIGNPHVSVAR